MKPRTPSRRFVHSGLRVLLLLAAHAAMTPGSALAASLSDTTNGTWAQLAPGGSLPGVRVLNSVILDPVRDRMVVFAGGDSLAGGGFEVRNDVWALPLYGRGYWTQLAPGGTPPSARIGARAIYDPLRDRMIAFGGSDGSNCTNDTWTMSLGTAPVWTQLTPSGTPPSARAFDTVIYDPVRDRLLVFGGSAGSSYFNDVWALQLAGTPTWTQLAPTGTPPSARALHTAIYDSVRDRMVVFGGSPGPLNDTWTLALAGSTGWSQLAPGGTPPGARKSHTAAYDPAQDRMIVFGGGAGSGSNLRNDVWALALAGSTGWSQLAPGGTPPSVRFHHSAIYDQKSGRMMVFAGYSGVFLNDTWALCWPTAGVGDDDHRPGASALAPPVPNPFTRGTTVSYSLPGTGRIRLLVHDVSGRLVRDLDDGLRSAGTHVVVWDGTDAAGSRPGAGVFFVTLDTPGVSHTRRVVLLE